MTDKQRAALIIAAGVAAYAFFLYSVLVGF